MIATAAALVASALSTVMLMPQLVRLVTRRDTAGVSADWLALGAVLNASWTTYLVANHRWAALPATTAVSLSYLLALVLVVRLRGTGRARAAALAGATVAVAGTVGVAWGWTALGVLLGASYAVQVAPSIVAVHRSASPTGVSVPTWVISGIEGVLWLVYGAAHADVAIVIFAVLSILAAGLVVGRVSRTRSTPAPGAAKAGPAPGTARQPPSPTG